MTPVADTNVFVHGRNQPFTEAFTVPEVMEEIKSEKGKQNFETVDVKVRQPSEEFMEKVRSKSQIICSPTSEVDEKLVALALELDETLITDDKALQNLALHLEVDFEAFMADKIEEKRSWKLVCENCGSELEAGKCPKCGSDSIRRKPD